MVSRDLLDRCQPDGL